ncbi:MAG: FixH family protein [Gammaproteobacteria bacterium]
MNTAIDNNWHQQPWIWFVIALLGVTMLASFGMLFLAMKNAPELVVENYSNIEEFTATTRAQDERARELGLSATVYIKNDIMSISFDTNNPVEWPETIVVRTVNSTLASLDRRAEFIGSQGRYTGSVELPGNAYDLHLEDPQGSWRLSKRVIGIPTTLEMSAFNPTEQ